MLPNTKDKELPLFEIIGQDRQTLQLVLHPEESIVTNTPSIIYQSQNLKQEQIKASFMESLLLQPAIKLTNQSKSINYIGLQKKQGHIIALRAQDNFSLLFNPLNLLAYSTKIKFDKKNEISELKQNFWKPEIDWEGADSYFFLQSECKEYPKRKDQKSNTNLIEKELGESEEILVKPNAIFAYSSEVKLSPYTSPEKRIQLSLLRARGPGKLYMEANTQAAQQVSKAKTQARPPIHIILNVIGFILFLYFNFYWL